MDTYYLTQVKTVTPSMVSQFNWHFILLVAQPVCVRVYVRVSCVRVWSNVITDLISLCLLGESAVPELHRSSVLLSATSHLLLSGKSLPHDAAGETPPVFHLEVHPPHSTHKHTHKHWTLCSRIRKQKWLQSKVMVSIIKFTWPPSWSTPFFCTPVKHSLRDE